MSEPTLCPTCGTPLSADHACPKCASASTPDGRIPLSALAVGAALAAAGGAAALVLSLLFGASLRGTEGPLWTSFVTGVLPRVSHFALGAACALGVVAWVRIRKRRGALRGERWAAAAAFVPFVVWGITYAAMPAYTVSVLDNVRPKTVRTYFIAESASGDRIKVDAAEESRIDELWARVCRLPATPTLADAEDLYSPSDFKVLKTLRPDGLAKDARAGQFGLPLLPRDVLSCPDLTMYSLSRVKFGAPIASDRVAADCRAIATATDGKRHIRFVLTRDGSRSDWYFGPYKVEFE